MLSKDDKDNLIHEVAASIPGLLYQFKMSPDGIMSFSYSSEGSMKLLGIEQAAMYDNINAIFKNVYANDLPDLIEAIYLSSITLKIFTSEFRIKTPADAGMRWICAVSQPHRTGDGTVIWNGIMTDVTMSKAGNDRMKLTSRAVDKAMEGIIITDVNTPDNGIIFANRSFYEMTGYKAHEVIGKNCRFLQGPDTDPEIIDSIRQKIKDKQRYTCELINYKKNGEAFWNCLTMIPMTDIHGVVTHFAGFQNDITERKLADEKVLKASEELMAFNYTVSHDLQGPLRTMSAFSKILSNGYGAKLDKEANEYLHFIEDSAKKMSLLIKGMLAFSIQGKAALNFDKVDMAWQVREIISMCMAGVPGCKADIRLGDMEPAICDMDLMRQVWSNLIGNAIKYSAKKETPLIEIGQAREGSSVFYYVKDNGAGFDNQNNKRLFRPFQRMHTAEEFEGTGIGLATVQRIIARHGGRIWAESAPNQGAAFYFTLQEAI